MEYINTHFVAFGDLGQVDYAIEEISAQAAELESRIVAKTSGSDAPIAGLSQATELARELQSLQIQQQSADDVVPVLEALVSKHGPLRLITDLEQIVREKVLLQAQVEQLQAAAAVEEQVQGLSEGSDVAEFEAVAKNLKELSPKAEEAGKHDSAQSEAVSSLHELFSSMVHSKRSALSADLSAILQEIHWLSPKEKVTIGSAKLKQIQALFDDLLRLQAAVQIPQYPDHWWALETLLEPYVVRFNFHFSDPQSKTNKISKPEWALAYVETFLQENSSILELVFDESFLDYGKIGLLEVISYTLVPLRKKLVSMAAKISRNISAVDDEDPVKLDQAGRLLSHLIFETTSFDQRLRTNYKYNPFLGVLTQTPSKKWLGLTGDIFTAENSPLENWLSLELRLAKKRFDLDILARPDAFDIDLDYSASSKSPESVLNPSYSSFALVKLLDNLTTHFKTLSIVKFQLKYVSKIQLSLLDEYLAAMEHEYRRFNESLRSKLISSFLPGTHTGEASSQDVTTNGLKGLEILTGLYCSARFIIEKMEEWSEDLIFVQLWEYCKDSTTETIFGESLKRYRDLSRRISAKYEEFFRKEFRGVLKSYVNHSQWDVEERTTQTDSQFVGLSTTILPYLAYLRRSLPDVDYFVISSGICDSLAGIFMEYVVTNNQFSKTGISQLEEDLNHVTSVLGEPLLLSGSAPFSNAENKMWNKVLQAVEMMRVLDYEGARIFKKRFDDTSVRALFDNKLDCLSGSDIHDLLYRIV